MQLSQAIIKFTSLSFEYFNNKSFSMSILKRTQSKTVLFPNSLKRNLDAFTSHNDTILRPFTLGSSFDQQITRPISPSLPRKNNFLVSNRTGQTQLAFQQERLQDKTLLERILLNEQISQMRLQTLRLQKMLAWSINREKKCESKMRNVKGLNYKYKKNNILSGIDVQDQQIPSKVYNSYEKLQQKEQGAVNFNKGVLDGGVIWFSVENELYFYPLDRLHDTSIIPIRLDSKVLFFIQNIRLRKNIKQRQLGQFLLLAYPYQIQIYDQSLARGKDSCLFKVKINCQRPSLFQTDFNGNLYYSDEKGNINCLILSENNTFDIFTKRKSQMRLKNYKSQGQFRKRFYQGINGQLGKVLKYFIRQLKCYGKWLVGSIQNQVILSIDNNNQLLSMLLTCLNKQFIRVFDVSRINPLFLYEIDVQQFLHSNLDKKQKDKIKTIKIIDSLGNRGSNLMIYLENGFRIYCELTHKILKFICLFKSVKVRKQRQSQDRQKNVIDLCQTGQGNDQIIDVVIGENRIIELKWEQKIIYLNSIRDSNDYYGEFNQIQIQNNKIQHKIFSFQQRLESNKNHLFNDKIVCISKELNKMSIQTRQFYQCADRFIYTNEQQLKIITFARPIDLILTILYCFEQQEQILIIFEKLYSQMDTMQILKMMVQISLERDTIYFISKSTYQKLNEWLRISKNIYKKYYGRKNIRFGYFKSLELDKDFDHKLIKIIDKITCGNRIGKQDKKGDFYLQQNWNHLNLDRIPQKLKKDKSQIQSQKTSEYNDNKESETKMSNKNENEQKIIMAIIGYLGRFLCLIWDENINEVKAQRCRYFIQNLKQVQLRMRRYETIVTKNKGYKLKQLNCFIDKITELLVLIRCVNVMPDLSFSQALSVDSTQFEECIFKFIKKQCDPGCLNVLRKLLPYYINDHLFKMCRLYQCLIDENRSEKIIQICESVGNIPSYLIDYLVDEKGIDRWRLTNSQKNELSVETKIIVGSDNPYLEFKEWIIKLKDHQYSLEDKQYFLQKASQQLDKLKGNISQQDQADGAAVIKQTNILLTIQRLLLQFYKKMQTGPTSNLQRYMMKLGLVKDQKNNTIEQKLRCSTFNKDDLWDMITDLGFKPLKAVYLFYFGLLQDCQQQIKQNLNQKTQIKQQDLIKFMKEQIHYYLTATKCTVSSKMILEIFTNFHFQRDQSFIRIAAQKGYCSSQIFWVGSYLALNGCDLDQIWKFYVQNLAKLYNSNKPLSEQLKYFYTWLSCFYFVSDYMKINKSQLQNITKNIIARRVLQGLEQPLLLNMQLKMQKLEEN